MYRHWKSKVAIMQEGLGPLPWCDQCMMHILATKLFKHRQTDKCNKATERQLRLEMAVRCGEVEFSLDREERDDRVEGVAKFRYLRRTLDKMDDD